MVALCQFRMVGHTIDGEWPPRFGHVLMVNAHFVSVMCNSRSYSLQHCVILQ